MASPKATPGATGPSSEQPGLELTGRASGGKLSVTQKSELRKARASCHGAHTAMVAAVFPNWASLLAAASRI